MSKASRQSRIARKNARQTARVLRSRPGAANVSPAHPGPAASRLQLARAQRMADGNAALDVNLGNLPDDRSALAAVLASGLQRIENRIAEQNMILRHAHGLEDVHAQLGLLQQQLAAVGADMEQLQAENVQMRNLLGWDEEGDDVEPGYDAGADMPDDAMSAPAPAPRAAESVLASMPTRPQPVAAPPEPSGESAGELVGADPGGDGDGDGDEAASSPDSPE